MNSKTIYSREFLARTAAEATSLVDLLRRLDAPLGSGSLSYLRKRLKHYDINSSHYRKEQLPGRERRSYAKPLLEEAAARSQHPRNACVHGLPAK